MAAVEPAASSSGPRYAPEDPTLPKPWKALIDGSTLYYWNPETNVTQYEKPAPTTSHPLISSQPPVLSGQPTAASIPKLAPIPVANTMHPHGTQVSRQMVQQVPQQQVAHSQQQLGPPMNQHQGSQIAQQQASEIAHQPGQQLPQQQSPHVPQQVQQFLYPQMYQMQYQQTLASQGQQFQSQGPQLSQSQAHLFGFSKREEFIFQQGNQTWFQSNHGQQPGFSSVPGLATGSHPTGTQQIGFSSSQAQLSGGVPANAQKNVAPSPLLQQPEDGQQQDPGVPMVYSQPRISVANSHQPGSSLKTGADEVGPRRAGNELPLSNKEGAVVIQQQRFGSMPMARGQQDMRMSFHNQQLQSGQFLPGSTVAPVHPSPNLCSPIPGGSRYAFPSVNPMRPSPRIIGSMVPSDLSLADAYRQQHEVTATGENVPAPFTTFEATGFPPEILREIHFAGFASPTPIQAQTWPIALQSRDVVAIARTGSGKTLGYIIPAFIHLRRCQNNPQTGPTVLVLAPTRELATQIQDEVMKFGRSSRVSCACLYGGAPKGPQLKEIERGSDIVVATPGRLNDILEMRKINFSQVSFLVLDEADRMLDMGFEPQIRKIVNEIPPQRQTLMYTATWPKEVRKIAGDLLINPVQVNIGSIDELAANKSITQYVEVVSPLEKQRRLEQILRSQERGSKIIVFCSTKRLCDQLARSIGRNFGAAAIHGDKSQGERDWVLNQFRCGKAPILVATDVAARGLDIKDIRVVINYDFPTGIEDYVHRIGRTGRAGATGISYTFFSDQDWKYAADLIKVLEGANQRVPPEVREMAVRGGPVLNKAHGGAVPWDSGIGGRWDSGNRSGRDGRFGGREGGFGRGSRNDMFAGRVNRGRGFGGPGGRIRYDRYDMEGRGRYSSRRGGFGGRRRGRSFSPSPDRSCGRGYGRSRSRSRSRSWSRSRSRSWSRSPSRSRSRSRSQSYDRDDRSSYARTRPRRTGFGPPVEPQVHPPLDDHKISEAAPVVSSPAPEANYATVPDPRSSPSLSNAQDECPAIIVDQAALRQVSVSPQLVQDGHML